MANSTDYLKQKYTLKDLDFEYYESIGLDYASGRGRGMSSFQRLIITVMLFLAILVIGTVFLVLTERLWLF
ncbi:MAG: hypothetical protein KAH97_00180 [Anaerolineales bacterium]|nr:hypothetical protein [Anaerolineales bacterium]